MSAPLRQSRQFTHAAMAAAELFASRHWVYGLRDNEHVPDIEEITSVIDRLVRSVSRADEMTTWCQSGRLMAMRDETGVIDIFLHLGEL